MRICTINLSSIEDVETFVSIMNKCPFEADLVSGRYVIDAKSIMGIFSLDLNKPITMEVYENDCEDLLEEIKPFLA